MSSTNMDVVGSSDKQCSIKHDVISNVPIRALYVRCGRGYRGDYTWDKVRKYFEQYGEIECDRIVDSNVHKWLLRYKNAESAKSALSMSTHKFRRPEGELKVLLEIKTEAADLWHQPDYPIAPPAQESESNILNALNDDCLYAVFGHLEFLDLANVAEVCVRFKQLSTETFSRKCNGSIWFGKVFSERYEDIDIVLRNFGSKVEALNVDFVESESKVFDIINEHCTSANSSLKELRIIEMRFGPESEKFCPIFARLEKLHIVKCRLSEALLAACSELKELTIRIEDDDSPIKYSTFPKLETFGLHRTPWSDTQLSHFVRLNTTLESVSVISNIRMTAENVVRVISENVTHLVNLEIGQFVGNLMEFQSEVLEVLKLTLGSASIGPVIKALAVNELPIKELTLYGVIDNEVETVRSISQMKQITALKLEWWIDLTDEHLITLAKELPQLQEMHLKYRTKCSINGIKIMLSYATKLRILEVNSLDIITIKVGDYNAILHIILNRPGRENLLIKVNEYANIPKETLLLANSNILCIKQSQ